MAELMLKCIFARLFKLHLKLFSNKIYLIVEIDIKAIF